MFDDRECFWKDRALVPKTLRRATVTVQTEIQTLKYERTSSFSIISNQEPLAQSELLSLLFNVTVISLSRWWTRKILCRNLTTVCSNSYAKSAEYLPSKQILFPRVDPIPTSIIFVTPVLTRTGRRNSLFREYPEKIPLFGQQSPIRVYYAEEKIRGDFLPTMVALGRPHRANSEKWLSHINVHWIAVIKSERFASYSMPTKTAKQKMAESISRNRVCKWDENRTWNNLYR